MPDYMIRSGRKAAFALGTATAVVLGLLTMAIFSAPAAKAWTGCAFGGFGTHVAGLAVDSGDPYGYGANGQVMGVLVGCDIKFNQKFVAGAEVAYGWVSGDLGTLGIDTDLTITGRAGWLVTPAALLYGHGGWARLEGGGDHINGYKFGAGAELKVPENPIYIDLRYSRGIWDVPGIPSTVDVTSDEFRVGLKFKFGAGLPGEEKPAKVQNSIK